jgi:hypothetical protein
MGQQPNIELDVDHLPRSAPEPGAPSGWKPDRPGEINSPSDMATGGVFGNPSPDSGWVVKLVRQAEFDRSSRVVDDVVATIASARASVFGRGPVPDDVEAALIILGLRDSGLDQETRRRLDEKRFAWMSKVPHEIVSGRAVLDDFDRDFLNQSLDNIRAGLAAQLT